MAPTSCLVICFSPTGTTRKIAEAVARGTGLPCTVADCTLPGQRNETIALSAEISADVLAILAVPVYFGRVQAHAASMIAALKGRATPALLVVNYGNRHYDDALLELFTLASRAGFLPLAAGAFVSEHSLHTLDFPLAKGRPEHSDLETATAFGAEALRRLAEGMGGLAAVPGAFPYRPYPQASRAPVSTESCTLCGHCLDLCPTGALVMESGLLITDEKNCIMCQACVKGCPEAARVDNAPGAIETRQRIMPLTATRREPEIFW